MSTCSTTALWCAAHALQLAASCTSTLGLYRYVSWGGTSTLGLYRYRYVSWPPGASGGGAMSILALLARACAYRDGVSWVTLGLRCAHGTLRMQMRALALVTGLARVAAAIELALLLWRRWAPPCGCAAPLPP